MSTITQRNEDVRPMVDASCKYGYNYLGIPNKDKQFCLLAAADVHGDKVRMASAIQYMNEVPSIDAGIILGDMAPSNFRNPHEWYCDCVRQAIKPWYTVIGNHDCGNSDKGEISAAQDQIFDRWIKPTLPVIGDISIKKPYYAVRHDRYKVELIVLDCHENPDMKDENGDFLVHRGANCFSQAQIDWLTAELAAVPQGWTVVAALHTLSDEIELDRESCWNSRRTGGPVSDDNCYKGMIPSIFDAWIHGKCIERTFKSPSRSGKYDACMPVISVSADYTERGEGLFACYLCGHDHRDEAGRCADFPEQHYFAFNTAAADNWQNGGCDFARAHGTKAEDCLTAVTIDTQERKVKLVRIGANFTMDMERREFAVVGY